MRDRAAMDLRQPRRGTKEMTTEPELKLPDNPSATDLLRLAQHYVGIEREPQHGDKLQNHQNIATLWSAYLFLLEKNRKDGTDQTMRFTEQDG